MHEQDAFGHALMACYRGETNTYHIERDDNYLEAGDLRVYFPSESGFSTLEQAALTFAEGRVLDIGCGAGKHAVFLQERGVDVFGIDVSQLALEVCKLRGLKQTKLLSISELDQFSGSLFDRVIMMGNNFGLFGSFAAARMYLNSISRITRPNARIIAVTSDPYATTDLLHLDYHRFNLLRGRMAGQIRFRIRFRNLTNDWMDYLFASQVEIQAIVHGTGWKVEQFNQPGPDSHQCLSILRKGS